METKNNTGLTVVVTLLVVAVLGLIGFIVYDKLSEKEVNEPNPEVGENNGESNNGSEENNKIEVVDINDLQPQVASLITDFPSLFKSVSHWGKFDKEATMNIAAIAASEFYKDVYEVGGETYKGSNVFVEAKHIETSFKKWFGPDVEFKHHTFDDLSCQITTVYDSDRQLYWGFNECGWDGPCNDDVVLSKIEKQGDTTIITHWIKTRTCDPDYSSSEGTSELIVNFKKQSDGNYYLEKEWF